MPRLQCYRFVRYGNTHANDERPYGKSCILATFSRISRDLALELRLSPTLEERVQYVSHTRRSTTD